MKIFKIRLAALVLMLMSVSAFAENNVSRQGYYLGLGYAVTMYDSVQDDVFSATFEDESTRGFQLFGGHMWDIGRNGAWALGVEGMYADRGTVSADYLYGSTADYGINVYSVAFVSDYEIASWVDILLKVGVAFVDSDSKAEYASHDYKSEWSESNNNLHPGLLYGIGFAFYPTQHVSVELALQMLEYTNEESTLLASGSTSASLRYQF